MRIGVFTDLHLGLVQYGLKEREEDFYNQYDKAIQTFVDAKVDIVVTAGDIFDKPRPSPKALEVFTNGLNILKENDIQVLNIIGNHSMVKSSDFVTADEFIKVTGLEDSYILLDEDNTFTQGDTTIVGLPYHYNTELSELIEKINHLNDKVKGTKHNILVLHQEFKEFCNYTGAELSINDINVENFDLIICGHIHEKKLIQVSEDTIFLQPGSLERSSIAEAKDEENNGKGVFIFDSEDINIDTISNGFIRLKPERKFLIADMYMNEKEDFDNIKNEILTSVNEYSHSPILFLTVHDKTQSYNRFIDLTGDLKSEFLTVHFNYFDESNIESEEIITSADDIPTPREALRLALNPLDEDEAKLGLDMYDLLKDGKDAKKILDDFLEKRIEENRKKVEENPYEAEIRELEEFFENL